MVLGQMQAFPGPNASRLARVARQHACEPMMCGQMTQWQVARSSQQQCLAAGLSRPCGALAWQPHKAGFQVCYR